MCPNITNTILCLMFCFLVFFVLTKIFGLQTFELVIAGKSAGENDSVKDVSVLSSVNWLT